MRTPGRLLAVALFALAPFAPAAADEIADQIREGLAQYEQGKYTDAVTSLNFAVGQIQQKQASSLKDVFPAPLEGWSADEAAGGSAPAALMGGGISASRRYFVEGADKTVDVEIVSDSPLLQSFLMFLTNPALLGAEPGTKLVKVQGYRALQRSNAQERQHEVTVVLQSRMLVSVRGQGLEGVDEVTAYAAAIDYKALEEYLKK